MRLVIESQHDNAREIGRWISDDVREIQVERDENTALTATNVNYTLVRLTAEGLLNDRMSVVPGSSKHRQ